MPTKPIRVLALAVLATWAYGAAEVPRQAQASSQGPEKVLWKNPGAVEKLDFAGGPGGRAKAPKPPFVFVEEDDAGSTPKIKVKDAAGRLWSVKWGEEVNSENFASRVAWACGYYVPPTYFVAKGTVRGAKGLKRARSRVEEDGSFVNARFQLRDPNVNFLPDRSWSWNDNPFLNMRELAGLKIIMMLTSNWDNKDARDVEMGTNTGILDDSEPGRKRFVYFVTDWGGSMGKWGGVFRREKWDSEGYAAQTPDFVKGVQDGIVQWGYQGQRTGDATQNISVDDVRWVLRYLGRITDAQLRAGLHASGATPAEITTFVPAIRSRINQLRAVARTSPASKPITGVRR